MHTKLGVFLVFSLFMMMVPAYAEVTTVSMKKSFYTVDEMISFFGTESEGSNIVTVVVRSPNANAKLLGGFSDSQGGYETIPKNVKTIFSTKGIYNVTAFVDKIEDGVSIQLEFDGQKVTLMPNFVLALDSISDKTVEEKKTLVFTPTLTESLTGVTFSLEKNPPTGASINSETGQFTWTPTESQGPASYVFDIVVKKGASEDRENIKITVTEPAPVIQPEPTVEEPTPVTEPEPEPTQELGIASFVDPKKDPQSYVDRYNNEPTYKKWFDENFPEYSSIYEAVGLDEPKQIASFVDPTLDPQFYIDRYNNEPQFREWFDENYPDMTIYDAIGVDKPEIKEQEMGQCGPGTILVDGVCTPDESVQEGGGCLIATAAYGSEMAPQVQQLREIRDNSLLQTASGTSFINTFNDFYYSFSPTVADWERENLAFKEFVKISLTPLISSLSI